MRVVEKIKDVVLTPCLVEDEPYAVRSQKIAVIAVTIIAFNALILGVPVTVLSGVYDPSLGAYLAGAAMMMVLFTSSIFPFVYLRKTKTVPNWLVDFQMWSTLFTSTCFQLFLHTSSVSILSSVITLMGTLMRIRLWWLFLLQGIFFNVLHALINYFGDVLPTLHETFYSTQILPIRITYLFGGNICPLLFFGIGLYLIMSDSVQRANQADAAIKMNLAVADKLAQNVKAFDTDGVGKIIDHYADRVDEKLLRAFTSIHQNLEEFRSHIPDYVIAAAADEVDGGSDEDSYEEGDGDDRADEDENSCTDDEGSINYEMTATSSSYHTQLMMDRSKRSDTLLPGERSTFSGYGPGESILLVSSFQQPSNTPDTSQSRCDAGEFSIANHSSLTIGESNGGVSAFITTGQTRSAAPRAIVGLDAVNDAIGGGHQLQHPPPVSFMGTSHRMMEVHTPTSPTCKLSTLERYNSTNTLRILALDPSPPQSHTNITDVNSSSGAHGQHSINIALTPPSSSLLVVTGGESRTDQRGSSTTPVSDLPIAQHRVSSFTTQSDITSKSNQSINKKKNGGGDPYKVSSTSNTAVTHYSGRATTVLVRLIAPCCGSDGRRGGRVPRGGSADAVHMISKSIEAAGKIAKANGGAMQYMQGCGLMVSFNAASRISAHESKACKFTLLLKHAINELGVVMHATIVTSPILSFFAGNRGQLMLSVLGGFMTHHAAMHYYLGQTVGPTLSCIILCQHASAAAEMHFHVRRLGLVRVGRLQDVLSANPQDPPNEPLLDSTTVSQLLAAKEDAPADEWMYQLANQSKSNPHAAVNEAVDAALSGRLDDAQSSSRELEMADPHDIVLHRCVLRRIAACIEHQRDFSVTAAVTPLW